MKGEVKMQNPQKPLKKNKDMVSRKLGDELILIPVFNTNEEMGEIYSLNETAEMIWRLIDGKRTPSDIKNLMLKKYRVAEQKLNRDVARTIENFKTIKAII